MSEIENDVARVNTKRLDECQQYEITIVPRCASKNMKEIVFFKAEKLLSM